MDHLGIEHARFNGPDYGPALDQVRLTGQIERIFSLMRDGRWRTLSEIESATGDPAASISAQLRHLRKARFGAHTMNKRRRGTRTSGLFEYQVIVNVKREPVQESLF
jgi:hypothetical protein